MYDLRGGAAAKIRLIALLSGITALVAVLLLHSEPRHQGRTLRSWLRQYSDASLSETQKRDEAAIAIRAIGAEKALPELLRLVKSRDSRAREWVSRKSRKWEERIFRSDPGWKLQLDGIAGFEILGTNASPAVSELTVLLKDWDLAFVTARCLEQVGKSGETALCQCLTNQDWRVRQLAVSALASVTDDVEVYIARIEGQLKDREPAVRFATAECLGLQQDAPELAVPLLIKTLHDSQDPVSEQAAKGLTAFGTNAATAFSVFTNLLVTGRPSQVRNALRALPAINPAESISVLTNFVVNGDSAMLAATLKALKAIAPDLALEMTLQQFQSSAPQRQLHAIRFASDYPVKTPSIVGALKAAAKDNDADVASEATRAMKRMVQKEKEARGSVAVKIPGEPTYQDKTLGEWLKLQTTDYELAPSAIDALRSMGTNLIPALLTRLAYREPIFGLYDYDVSIDAVRALISLRESAIPALPALQALMDEHDSGLVLGAMLATLGTGSNALPCIMKGFTNEFPDVRNEAAHTLFDEWGDPYPEARLQARPILIKFLNDPDPFVRENATNQLKQLDRAVLNANLKDDKKRGKIAK